MTFAELQTEVAASHLLIAAGYRLWRDRVAHWIPPWLPLLALASGVVCYTELTPWWASRLMAPFLLAIAVNHFHMVLRPGASASDEWGRSENR